MTDQHPIFTKDPSEWMRYVGMKTCITTSEGTKHIGYSYTVDPVSRTFCLMVFDSDDTVTMEIIPGDVVQSIQCIDEDNDVKIEKYTNFMNRIFRNDMKLLTQDNVKLQCERVKAWLLKHRLPVKELSDSKLSISGALIIEAPYGVENCHGTNEIILGKIQGLIETMPNDVMD